MEGTISAQQIRFVQSGDGTRIACAAIGSGTPLVKAPNWLSHAGIDGESPVWRHWWRELAREHRFVRFDQRGCGLSDRDILDLSFDRWVEDLEAVADAFAPGKFVLLGMSQGGAVAVAYAARHPERVSRLVLVGAYALGWARRNEAANTHRALLTLIREGWGSDNPAFRQVFTSQFMPDATPEQMRWFNQLEQASTSAESAHRFQDEVGKIDVSRVAATLAVPVLVAHSRYDARVPFEQGRRLAAIIPDAQFLAMDSQNHILLEGEPAWASFVTRFREFLRYPDDTSDDAAARALGRLSPREREVLLLVARGMTDREVAGALSVSTRTVGNHVRSILSKTGVVNRTAAAAMASRLRLS